LKSEAKYDLLKVGVYCVYDQTSASWWMGAVNTLIYPHTPFRDAVDHIERRANVYSM